jgi:RNA polymerase sigma factor (sigma-70 family)
MVDDACQAVLLVLQKQARSLRSASSLGAWLHAVSRSACQRIQRDEARRRRREQHESVKAPAPSFPIDEDRNAVRGELDGALSRLTTSQREAIIRRYLEGKEYAEIASNLKSTETAVKKRVADGLLRLRELLGRRGIAVTVSGLAANLAQESAAGEMTHSVTSTASAISLAQAVQGCWNWIQIGWVAGMAAVLLSGVVAVSVAEHDDSFQAATVVEVVPAPRPIPAQNDEVAIADAVMNVVHALRANDMAALLATRREAEQTTILSVPEGKADRVFTLLRQLNDVRLDDETLVHLAHMLSVVIPDAGKSYLTPAAVAHLRGAVDAFGIWAVGGATPEAHSAANRALADISTAIGVRSETEWNALTETERERRLGTAMAAFKSLVKAYGFDVDALLDSARVVTVATSADSSIADLAIRFGDLEIILSVELGLEHDRWFVRKQDETTELAMLGLPMILTLPVFSPGSP